jgi:hypothetical protein
MSHIVTLKTQITNITNIDALDTACNKLDLRLNRGQKSFKSFGSVRPACEHAISMAQPQQGDYEIGLVQDGDAFTLKYDFYNQHNRLEKAVGANCDLLTQRYAVEVARAEAQAKGFECFETVEQDESITLQVCVGAGA